MLLSKLLFTLKTLVKGRKELTVCSVMLRAIQALRFSHVHMQQCKQTTWLGTKGTDIIRFTQQCNYCNYTAATSLTTKPWHQKFNVWGHCKLLWHQLWSHSAKSTPLYISRDGWYGFIHRLYIPSPIIIIYTLLQSLREEGPGAGLQQGVCELT